MEHELQNAHSFSYTPLRPDETRLLILDPNSSATELKCSIKHVSITSPPPYMALSYVWGDSSIRRPILLNGYQFHVTANLAAFLDQARADYETYLQLLENNLGPGKPLTLWIDAVCINQADLIEKGKQVTFMKQIYERAAHVLAWLGPADADSEAAFDGMMWLQRYNDAKKQELGENSTDMDVLDHIQRVGYLARSSKSDDGPLGMRPWHAMDVLFRRSWWSRVWIVQESTTNVPTQLICGARMVPRDTIDMIVGIYAKLKSFPWNANLARIQGPLAPMRLFFFSFERQHGCCKMQLLRVLDFLRNLKATDPRDKVFAGLGLAVDYAPGDMLVDYGLSIAAVYTELAKYWITSRGSLDLLGFVGLQNSDVLGLPSWVPDWSCSYRSKPFYKYLGCGCGNPQPLYNASESSTKELAVVNGNKLICDGLLVDQIASLGPAGTEDDGDVTIQESWMPQDQQGIYKQTGETMLHAYFRTLLADAVIETETPVSRASNLSWASSFRPGDNLLKVIRDGIGANKWNPIFEATCRRRFMVTKRGYIGLAPSNSSLGDQIWTLRGGKVLYVLRCPLDEPVEEGTFLFVGECYLHGLMDGEATQSEQGMETVILK